MGKAVQIHRRGRNASVKYTIMCYVIVLHAWSHVSMTLKLYEKKNTVTLSIWLILSNYIYLKTI